MTRRDFLLISETIREMDLHPEDKAYVAQQFADALVSTNPNFDRKRFLTAALGAS